MHPVSLLSPGSCDGMTYEEMVESMPHEFELRKSDKLAYRYPRWALEYG